MLKEERESARSKRSKGYSDTESGAPLGPLARVVG